METVFPGIPFIFPPFPSFPEEEKRLNENLERLKSGLDAEQRKLLLRVIDDQEMIGSLTAEHYYAEGFRNATKLMIHCLYLDENV